MWVELCWGFEEKREGGWAARFRALKGCGWSLGKWVLDDGHAAVSDKNGLSRKAQREFHFFPSTLAQNQNTCFFRERYFG